MPKLKIRHWQNPSRVIQSKLTIQSFAVVAAVHAVSTQKGIRWNAVTAPATVWWTRLSMNVTDENREDGKLRMKSSQETCRKCCKQKLSVGKRLMSNTWYTCVSFIDAVRAEMVCIFFGWKIILLHSNWLHTLLGGITVRENHEGTQNEKEIHLLKIIRELQFGEIKIIVQDGQPIRIEEMKKTIKL